MAALVRKALVVVESPSKAKTIQKYLGRKYIVKASVGHIKDLPKSKLGVDPTKGFEADYQVIPKKVKVLEELKKAYDKVPELYIATDPDREGEAIAWHLNEELKKRGKKVHRILLYSITKDSILNALENPSKLNTDKYRAQQARRILDRLVGYKISPLLWDKVKRGLSAGRVQSVALRLVVEREASIKEFEPVEYWEVEAVFTAPDGSELKTRLFKVDGKKPEMGSKEVVDGLLNSLDGVDFAVSNIEKKERNRKPTPPFITSRLQQEAAGKLGFSAKKTMTLAQKLYEGVDLQDMGTTGLITYMRTDSVRTDPAAVEAVRTYIGETYGEDYLPKEANTFKTKKNAQDAHEAIRPVSLELPPDKVKGYLDKDEQRLYELIWNRFVASQMKPAVYDQTTIDLSAKSKDGQEFTFRATGSVIKFKGFMALYYEEKDEEKILKLPKNADKGMAMELKAFDPSQHFTQPPPRYTDASLIRDLEEKGIGRPSTYASILSNLQDRDYVEKRGGRYFPSELGQVVTELLVDCFPNILNAEFTAAMESNLDKIEEGEATIKKTLGTFWKPFEKTLEQAKVQMKNVKRQEVPTDVKCEECKHMMVIKWGKLGSFLACSNYPECKNTQDYKRDDDGNIVIIPKEYVDKDCEKCESKMVVKAGKYGKFLACSNYPNCKFTAAITLGIPCPKCKDGEICQRQSRYNRMFYGCNKWPDCDFATWDRPVSKPCPKCKYPVLTEKLTKRIGHFYKCPNKEGECDYINVIDPSPQYGTLDEIHQAKAQALAGQR